jgi:ABC-type glycerol-3-phosphate transport system permease component
MKVNRRSQILIYIALTVYALVSVYPFLWMISASLKPNREVLRNASLIPEQVEWGNIAAAWEQLEFFQYFGNSAIISILTVLGIIAVYSLAGYGFAKTRFWGRNFFFGMFLAVLFVPGVTVLIPLVQLIRALGFTGREASQASVYAGLILPMINGAGPFAILLFRNYYAALPDELRDAARVDGCSEWGIYARIFLPLSVPVIATVGVLNFIATWNSYVWPSIVLNNPDWITLPLKLREIDLQAVIQWNMRMAGSLIMVVPVIVLFLFLQRYYIRGLVAGAVKG